MKLFKFDLVTFYAGKKNAENAYYKYLTGRRDAFPVDTEKPHETAIKWASRGTEGPEWVVDVENEFTDLKVVHVEHRSQGGRAYKVLLTVEGEEIIVEIRDKVFEEYILNGNINNGVLSGTWKFINDRGASLVPVDSHWAKDYDKIHRAAPATKVKPKDQKPMEAYKSIGDIKNKNPAFCIYLGEVYREELENGSSFSNISLNPDKLYLYVTIFYADYLKNPDLKNFCSYLHFDLLKSKKTNLYKVGSTLSVDEKIIYSEFKKDGIGVYKTKEHNPFNERYRSSTTNIFRNSPEKVKEDIIKINNLVNIVSQHVSPQSSSWIRISSRTTTTILNKGTYNKYVRGEIDNGNFTTTDLCSTWV